MKYARIINSAVVEILVPVEGFTFEQCFHVDIADKCVPVSEEVTTGWLLAEDGTFSAPPVVEPVTEAPVAK